MPSDLRVQIQGLNDLYIGPQSKALHTELAEKRLLCLVCYSFSHVGMYPVPLFQNLLQSVGELSRADFEGAWGEEEVPCCDETASDTTNQHDPSYKQLF